MKIAIGCDHAGFPYKDLIIEFLESENHVVSDKGTDSADSVDYPDFAHPVSASVDKEDNDLGILICGSGNGVCMTANKYQNVRAALCWTTEIAALAKAHNNANIVCIPARFTSSWQALAIVKTFMETAFEGGRHGRRVGKIGC